MILLVQFCEPKTSMLLTQTGLANETTGFRRMTVN
jgi:hypothetical protein